MGTPRFNNAVITLPDKYAMAILKKDTGTFKFWENQKSELYWILRIVITWSSANLECRDFNNYFLGGLCVDLTFFSSSSVF